MMKPHEFADALAATIEHDPSMGDEADVADVLVLKNMTTSVNDIIVTLKSGEKFHISVREAETINL